MRVLKHSVRIVALLGCVVVAASSGTTKQQSGYKTEKNAVFYEPQPEFEWRHRRGNMYRIVLSQLPRDANEQRRVLDDVANFTQAKWRPKYELDFGRAYELFVWDQNGQVVTSWRFTIAFQPPKMIEPKAGAKVNNLSPEFRLEPFSYGQVFYAFEISTDSGFNKVIESEFISHRDNLREFPGEDQEMGTKDDIRYISWTPKAVLKPNKTYYWRVRGYYYLQEELASGAVPEKNNALGNSEETGTFTIPPGQTGSDSLSNLTIITTEKGNAWQPNVSVNYDMVYVMFLPNGGSELRVASAEMRGDRPVFGTARREFSKSVQGSHDLWPSWDVDGEGIFFASDRSQRSYNLWYKRSDSRGYTQLTFHSSPSCAQGDYDSCGAYGPSVSKDGNKIAYHVTNPENTAGVSLWKIDRDGRGATEIGSGMRPKFSHDGKNLVFAKLDAFGNHQIWTMDADGGNRQQLTNQFNNHHPEWHPSGKRIVFVSNRAGNDDIWELELDGARLRQLTNYLGDDWQPAFTPDGKWLLFSSTRDSKTFEKHYRIWMGALQ